MVGRYGKNGWAIWITGLPGSGKSTIAKALLRHLLRNNINVQLISMDELRRIITPNPKYTEEERDILYGCITFIAKKLTKFGINVIIDSTGNKRKYRDQCRKAINRFVEVYLKCPLEICIKRELSRKQAHYAPKNIYRKAILGKSYTVPGIGVPYEEPLKAEVLLCTDKLSAKECVKRILDYIQKKIIKWRFFANI